MSHQRKNAKSLEAVHTHTHTFILGDNINVVKNSYDKVEQNRIKKHRKTVYICDTKIDCLW